MAIPKYALDNRPLFYSVRKIRDLNPPDCPDCDLEMELRDGKYGQFWGCPNFSTFDCRETGDYNFEDKLAFLNYYHPSRGGFRRNKFSKAFSTLKYGSPPRKLEEAFAEAFYNMVEKLISPVADVDFFASLPSTTMSTSCVQDILEMIPDFEYFPDLIVDKRKNGRSQKEAGTAEARRENVRDAYSLLDPQSVNGSTIVVVDDIVTTGASIDEVTKLVHSKGAENPFAACFGKTKRQR